MTRTKSVKTLHVFENETNYYKQSSLDKIIELFYITFRYIALKKYNKTMVFPKTTLTVSHTTRCIRILKYVQVAIVTFRLSLNNIYTLKLSTNCITKSTLCLFSCHCKLRNTFMVYTTIIHIWSTNRESFFLDSTLSFPIRLTLFFLNSI